MTAVQKEEEVKLRG